MLHLKKQEKNKPLHQYISCNLSSTPAPVSPAHPNIVNYTGAINHISLSCSDTMKSCAFYRFLLANLVGYKEGPEESYGTNYTRKTGESN